MFEQSYQKNIIKKLESKGYYVLKLIKTNKNGISDILALKANKTAIFIECKLPKGKISELQKYRLNELKANGFYVFVSYGYLLKRI